MSRVEMWYRYGKLADCDAQRTTTAHQKLVLVVHAIQGNAGLVDNKMHLAIDVFLHFSLIQ